MRKLGLTLVLISRIVMLSCAGIVVRSQPKSLTRSAEDFGGAQSEEAGYQFLSPESLAKIRREAMGMDRRAYERSEAYRETPPAGHILRVQNCQSKA